MLDFLASLEKVDGRKHWRGIIGLRTRRELVVQCSLDSVRWIVRTTGWLDKTARNTGKGKSIIQFDRMIAVAFRVFAFSSDNVQERLRRRGG